MTGVVEVPELMTPGEVATAAGVDPVTLKRWAGAGRLLFLRTPGGHRRYVRSHVELLVAGGDVPSVLPEWPAGDPQRLLRSGQVSAIWRVDGATVARWADLGLLIPALRLPYGGRRFRESDVLALAGAR